MSRRTSLHALGKEEMHWNKLEAFGMLAEGNGQIRLATLWHCVQVHAQHAQVRRAYEARWQHFAEAAKRPGTRLTYIDIPWPAEEFASTAELQQVIFASTVVRAHLKQQQ